MIYVLFFYEYLSLNAHISAICRSTHFHLRNIGRVRNVITTDAAAQLIQDLILSRLDFVIVFFIISQITKLSNCKEYKTKQLEF